MGKIVLMRLKIITSKAPVQFGECLDLKVWRMWPVKKSTRPIIASINDKKGNAAKEVYRFFLFIQQ
jgi:hypothetical protein